MDLVLHQVPEDTRNSNYNYRQNSTEKFSGKVITEWLQIEINWNK